MNKNVLKKLGLILILIVIIVAIIFVAKNSSSGKKEEKTANVNTSLGNKTEAENVTVTEIANNNGTKTTTIKTLDDGTLYSVADDVNADIVIGDNYYDTQISDINLNFSNYEGKTIEIEGYYLKNEPYTFIGRYSNSNLCPNCPPGYSYFEYEWQGDKMPELKDEDSWLKVKGTLSKGNDGSEYYYIDVASLEVMNEKGIDTVNN